MKEERVITDLEVAVAGDVLGLGALGEAVRVVGDDVGVEVAVHALGHDRPLHRQRLEWPHQSLVSHLPPTNLFPVVQTGHISGRTAHPPAAPRHRPCEHNGAPHHDRTK